MNDENSFPVDSWLPHMRDVGKCERSLSELDLRWRMIESSAQMNCPLEARSILPIMAATRGRFSQLEGELVVNLVREKMRNAMAALTTKAQYVIDIVVRNLYERTADVGFLATDGDLCGFVAGSQTDAAAIRQRLRAYREKYTVYDDIILLDTEGRVLLRIDDSATLDCSRDALVRQSLASQHFVETFRATDLLPNRRAGLIYSRRMLHPQTGAVIGVLCLSFAFEEEMGRIFATHGDPQQHAKMLLLDGDNRVIASADPLWIPLGAQVPVNRSGQPALVMFAGRQYLARTVPSAGYQGYPGPTGWQGQVMIPVELAFSAAPASVLANLDAAVADGLLSHARTFCPPLFAIMKEAEATAETIRRVVWNGQVATAGQGGDGTRLKSILEQISDTGTRSNTLFAQAIGGLFETVLASRLSDSGFVAHLLVDLLDRNLYERANDCRWWALSPELRSLMARPEPTGAARMAHILRAINDLYTVYACLFVYDRNGCIIATSREAAGAAGYPAVTDETLQRVLALGSGQAYYVTPFAPSAMVDGQSTYVYHAAIRDPANDASIVGGIGIVFDASAEFLAMLRSGSAAGQNVQAYFVDRSGAILASTDASCKIGSRLEMAPSMHKLAAGSSASQVCIQNGQYAIMGCTASHGYREFKVSDGYRDDILAVVVESFGPVREGVVRAPSTELGRQIDVRNPHDFATFFVDGALFALPADAVCEALPAAHMSRASLGAGAACVGVLPLESGGAQTMTWVFDAAVLLAGEKTALDAASQIIVIRQGDRRLGLLVNKLHAVVCVDAADLVATPLIDHSAASLVRQVIKANAGELLIQVLDTPCLFEQVMGRTEPAPLLRIVPPVQSAA
ncbi:chemotaxis signal transduction protein [Actimicrobium sp. GrIS 1.19]|uniref:chemotaxis protein CheW n=1 Tax=Actimicrobium sp. GrIS 1.19 TaxID=3071708 RepID=UPI002DFE912F|nr:chemotaxis signal transduction protein [Actimicrobium sp. GrIS 1.19]